MIRYNGLSQDHCFFMNLEEAQSVIEKLSPYKGRNMQPFTTPVKDFLILPAIQHDFEAMVQDMADNRTPFDKAIRPYADRVTVLVCPKDATSVDAPNHCTVEYFLQVNDIETEGILREHAPLRKAG